jgi:PadR family transcriptional regulator PadR
MAEAGPKLLRGLLEVFILESLDGQPKHGYALLKEITEAFGQEPNRNRLYPLLAKLVRDGYIREVSESGGNRTLYALTDAGRDALHGYRKLPPAFRHALRRIWNVEVAHPVSDPSAPAPSHAALASRTIPVAVAPRADGALPYPCPDARMTVERDPTSGDTTVRLTGCPMGTYDYCPQCPMSIALGGVRKLVLP